MPLDWRRLARGDGAVEWAGGLKDWRPWPKPHGSRASWNSAQTRCESCATKPSPVWHWWTCESTGSGRRYFVRAHSLYRHPSAEFRVHAAVDDAESADTKGLTARVALERQCVTDDNRAGQFVLGLIDYDRAFRWNLGLNDVCVIAVVDFHVRSLLPVYFAEQ